ncbi:methyltransferase [Candidatus Woesearchaeota archaeon]|nr:methyltransferase [Candidatus Woesearchaeota archaeon]
MKLSKSGLAIELSKLKAFEDPSAKQEQYPTDSEIAAEVLWQAKMLGDVDDKKISDLGAGTGILGIGALLLGAEECIFVEKDADAVKICKENIEGYDINAEVIQGDINDLNEKCDVIIMNPPFGTKKEHADKRFLEQAFRTADIIYSFHKTSTEKFVKAIAKDHGFDVTNRWDFSFPLKKTHKFHKRKIHRIEVSCFRMQRMQGKHL